MIRHALQIFHSQLDKLLNHLHILEDLDFVCEEILASFLSDDVKSHAASVLRKILMRKSLTIMLILLVFMVIGSNI